MNSNAPLGDARKLWWHIYGDLEGFLCIASAVRNLDDNGVPIKSGKGATNNETFSEKYFWYPEEIDRALAYIREVNSMPLHEVWCSKCLFQTRKRKESNVVACGALAVELDGPPLPNGSVTPSAVVVSSPAHLNDDGKDHFHPYFALSRPTLPRGARDLNKRLGRWTGGQKTELSGLLRIPGTINWKHPEKPLVELVSLDDSRRFHWEDLDDLLPEGKKRVRP